MLAGLVPPGGFGEGSLSQFLEALRPLACSPFLPLQNQQCSVSQSLPLTLLSHSYKDPVMTLGPRGSQLPIGSPITSAQLLWLHEVTHSGSKGIGCRHLWRVIILPPMVVKSPLKVHVFKSCSPKQQCSEVELWGSDWFMRVLTSMD